MLLFNRSVLAKVKHLLWPAVWLTLVLSFLVYLSSLSSAGSWKSSFNNSTSSSLTNKFGSSLRTYFNGANYTLREDLKSSNTDIVTANISTSTKVAVIIETRASGAIIPLVLHFATVLGPDWPVVIYTNAENYHTFATSHALRRFQASGRIVVRSLAVEVYFPNWDSVSWFLTRKMMWEDLAPAENILIFQNDAIICSNSVRSVEEFFEWDMIGAPVSPQWGVGYNGGLSLRKRSSTLRVLDKFEWEKYGGMRAEDQWYYNRLVYAYLGERGG